MQTGSHETSNAYKQTMIYDRLQYGVLLLSCWDKMVDQKYSEDNEVSMPTAFSLSKL